MNLVGLALMAGSLLRSLLMHLWESTLFGLLVLAVSAICYKTPANLRKTLGWIGLVKFLLPSSLLVPGLKLLTEALAWLLNRPAAPAVAVTYRAFSSIVRSHTYFGPVLAESILGIWLLTTLVLFGRSLLARFRLARKYQADAVPAPASITQKVAVISTQLSLSRAPAVIVVESDGPGIVGVFPPLLVIPRGLERELTAKEFDAILTHECIHLRRHDPFFAAVRTSILALWWFNPIVWLLSRLVERETETACDEAVIDATGQPQAYADGLLKTVRFSLGLTSAVELGATTEPISSRITAIRQFQPKLKSPLMKSLALSIVCVAAVLSSYADEIPQVSSTASKIQLSTPVFDLSQLDRAPKVITQARPTYPLSLRNARTKGEAVIVFVVDSSGRVQDPDVVTTNVPEFGEAALAAVSQWTFVPGQKNGRNVFVRMQVPIVFKLGSSFHAGGS